MVTKRRLPVLPWLSPAAVRRVLSPLVKRIDPQAARLVSLTAERVGGFADRSYQLRYVVTVADAAGRLRRRTVRGSIERGDETRRQAFSVLTYLKRNRFPTASLTMTSPITYVPAWKMLVYLEARGQPLALLLRRGRSATTAVQLAARWLARLHQFRPRRVFFVYDHVGRRRYWQRAKRVLRLGPAADWPWLSQAVRDVLAVEDRLAKFRGRVLVHHDFHPGNILINGRVACGLDFTESRLAHPMIDVASWLAQIESQYRTTVSARVRQRWAGVFLRTYRRHTPPSWSVGAGPDAIKRFIAFRVRLQLLVYFFMCRQYAPGVKRLLKQDDRSWKRVILSS